MRAILASIQQQFRFLDKLLAVILRNYFFQTYRGYEKVAQPYVVHGLRGWFGYDVHHSVPDRSGNNNDGDRKFVICLNYVVRHFTTLTAQITTVRFRSCICRVSITKII